MLVPRRSRVLDSHCGADVCSKLEVFRYPEAQCMLAVMAAADLAHWQLVSSDTVMLVICCLSSLSVCNMLSVHASVWPSCQQSMTNAAAQHACRAEAPHAAQ